MFTLCLLRHQFQGLQLSFLLEVYFIYRLRWREAWSHKPRYIRRFLEKVNFSLLLQTFSSSYLIQFLHNFYFFFRIITNYHDEASRFVHLLTLINPNGNSGGQYGGRMDNGFSVTSNGVVRSHLVPEDFVPLVQDVVDTHPGLLYTHLLISSHTRLFLNKNKCIYLQSSLPGLTFLKEAAEFHSRYVHTVSLINHLLSYLNTFNMECVIIVLMSDSLFATNSSCLLFQRIFTLGYRSYFLQCKPILVWSYYTGRTPSFELIVYGASVGRRGGHQSNH